MEQYNNICHTFEPVYDAHSRILILGTFPSVKSRENKFYYGHPQNRFWKVIARITEENIPVSIEEKKELLLRHHIAVWDVIQSCTIRGSSDNSIRDVIPNDVNRIIGESGIRAVFGNGAKACELYEKYVFEHTKLEIQKLPSTSPANAAFSLEKIYNLWIEKIEIYL